MTKVVKLDSQKGKLRPSTVKAVEGKPKKGKDKRRPVPPAVTIAPYLISAMLRSATARGVDIQTEVHDRLTESLAQPAIERLVHQMTLVIAEVASLRSRVDGLEAAQRQGADDTTDDELLLMPVRRKRGGGR